MEQDVRGSRRPHALERSDDAGRRHRRLERIGLEPLVEEVRGAHRHQLHEHGLMRLREVAELLGEPDERQPLHRANRAGVRRNDREDRLDEARHVDHELAVLLVRLRVGP